MTKNKKYSIWAKLKKGFSVTSPIEWNIIVTIYVISAIFIFSPDTPYLSKLGAASIDFAITVMFIYLLYIWGDDALKEQQKKK